MKTLKRLAFDDSAATLVEYALLIALLAGAVIAAALLFRTSLYNLYVKIASGFSGA